MNVTNRKSLKQPVLFTFEQKKSCRLNAEAERITVSGSSFRKQRLLANTMKKDERRPEVVATRKYAGSGKLIYVLGRS